MAYEAQAADRTGFSPPSRCGAARSRRCSTDSRRNRYCSPIRLQVELRAIETLASFDTSDKLLTIRSVIATMQDLGFVIDKADEVLGTVSGTKLSGYAMRMTVTVRTSGAKQLLVRASAQYNLQAVSDPAPYQQFFAALEKSDVPDCEQSRLTPANILARMPAS